MSTIKELFTQSLLSQATYANLNVAAPLLEQKAALTDKDQGSMAAAEATDFASKWTVIEQYKGESGVSATIFHNIAENKNYLAIISVALLIPFLRL